MTPDPIRVALVTYALDCGGMETFLLRLARCLTERGIQVELVVTERKGAWEHEFEAAGLVLRRLYAQGHGRLRSVLEFVREIRRRRYAVLLLNHSETAQAAIPFIARQVAVLPVFHNHDPVIYRLGVRHAAGWDAAVCVSTRVLEEVRRSVPQKKTLLVPYGVPLPDGPPAPSPASRLLYVGRLENRQKGVFRLPLIMKSLAAMAVNAELTIIGDGPDKERLRAGFCDAGVSSLATFLGVRSPVETLKEMQTHGVLLLPSNYEGLPITVLEAMGRGCVPVASRLPGITDDAIEDGVSGHLIEPSGTDGFASAVRDLIDHPAVFREMQLAAARRAQSRFSLNSMADAYQQLIEAAAGGQFQRPVPRLFRARWDTELLPLKNLLPKPVRRTIKAVLMRRPAG